MLPIILLILIVVPLKVVCDQKEKELYEDLLLDYDPLERPVENHSLPVKVQISVVLQQIVDLDEKNQVIEVNAWLKFIWRDYNLVWDPDHYGGIQDLRFPHDVIWKPDVLLYNSASSEFDSTFPSNVVLYSDGTANWIPPGILICECNIDIRWFPFDDQKCYLKFGSWTYNGYQLDLQPENATMGIDTSDYIKNGEWTLLSTPVKSFIKKYSCCPEPYPMVEFYIRIRRRTLYYGFNFIIPSILISLMTILGFTLPPDACEKITLEITILFTQCVFLSMISNMTPPTSEALPLIGIFSAICLWLVSASVVFTVFVLNLHFRDADSYRMSPFVYNLFLVWLPWFLLMRRPKNRFNRENMMKEEAERIMENSKITHSESLMRNIRELEESLGNLKTDDQILAANRARVHQSINEGSDIMAKSRKDGIDLDTRISRVVRSLMADNRPGNLGVHALILQMRRIHTEVKFITLRMEEEDEEDQVRNDWKFAAMVVDRFCLFTFSIFLVSSICAVMFSAPHIL